MHASPHLLRRLAAAFALVAGAAAGAQTAPAAKVTGNAQAGQTIMTAGVPPAVAACASCHGDKAQGAGTFPPLTGSGAAYLQAQLDAFADGSRANPIMAPIAKGLNAQQRADVAAYLASLPSGIARAPTPPATPDPKDKGAWLALRGRMADGVPACASCHGPAGEGVGEHFPAIAHLNAAYMQGQVDAWKQGQRGPGPLGLMQGIAGKLSADDVAAVAAYYAGRAK